ncbi:hypothetical protein C8R46DRAFT_1223126 [Mycena filopes]|nr:hypothetical protein C8R46DRAFT_1223126 [Mycena filopes]
MAEPEPDHDGWIHFSNGSSMTFNPDGLDAILDDEDRNWGPPVTLDLADLVPPRTKTTASERALRKKILKIFARNQEYQDPSRPHRLNDIIMAIARDPEWYRIVKGGDPATRPLKLQRLMETPPLADLCHSYYLSLATDLSFLKEE